MTLRNGSITLALLNLFLYADTSTTSIYTLSLHDALPIWRIRRLMDGPPCCLVSLRLVGNVTGLGHRQDAEKQGRSEEHTSELQSPDQLVCRLLLEKKNKRC